MTDKIEQVKRILRDNFKIDRAFEELDIPCESETEFENRVAQQINALYSQPSTSEGLQELIEHEADYYAHEIVVPITGKPATPYEINAVKHYKAEFALFGDRVIAKCQQYYDALLIADKSTGEALSKVNRQEVYKEIGKWLDSIDRHDYCVPVSEKEIESLMQGVMPKETE